MVEVFVSVDISDGNFPNHHPDPCVEENLTDLKKKVLENHADLGIGYDGDADRVGFVDEKGQMIDIDKFLIIMWKYLYDKVDKKECLFVFCKQWQSTMSILRQRICEQNTQWYISRQKQGYKHNMRT